MTINSASIFPLYETGIRAITGLYPQYEDEWKKIYKTQKTMRAVEFDWQVRFLGSAVRKEEGMAIAQDTMALRYRQTFKSETYGLSFDITRNAMNDNLYKDQFPQHLLALAGSLRTMKKTVAAVPFNMGTTTHTTSDGVPFFSNNHPLDNGSTNSNLGNVALSEVGLQNSILGIQRFKQLSGTLANIKPVQLMVSPANQFVAAKIIGSDFSTTTPGDNSINPVAGTSYLPKGYFVNQYLTSDTMAVIINDVEGGLMHFEREAFNTWEWMDNVTRNKWFAAEERYVFDVSDWRVAYCVNP